MCHRGSRGRCEGSCSNSSVRFKVFVLIFVIFENCCWIFRVFLAGNSGHFLLPVWLFTIWSVVVDVVGGGSERIRHCRRRPRDCWVEPQSKKKKTSGWANSGGVVLTRPFLVFLPPIIYTTSAQMDLNNCLGRREGKKRRQKLLTALKRTWAPREAGRGRLLFFFLI